MIIDATNLVIGRIAAYAAKKALLNEEVIIVNCDKAIITGTKDFIKAHYLERKERGHPYDGPFYPKMADRILRRTIRGMLPYKQERGKQAYSKIMCYIGVPLAYQNKELSTVPKAHLTKLKTSNFMYLQEISTLLGKAI